MRGKAALILLYIYIKGGAPHPIGAGRVLLQCGVRGSERANSIVC